MDDKQNELNENQEPEQENANTDIDSQSVLEEKSDWDFQGEVQTELNDIELPYSGMEPVAEQTNDKDHISISKKSLKTIGISILSIILVVVLALGINFAFFTPNSKEILTPANVALTVDGEKISVGMYNYFYNTFTSDDYLSYYASSGLDTEKSFETQYYDEDKKITWAKYFENSVIDQIKYITYLCHKADKDGVELTDSQKKEIADSIQNLSTYAENGKQSTSQYIKDNYGDYVGKKTIEKVLTYTYIAKNYAQQQSVGKKYDSAEIDKYAKNNSDELQTVSFRYLPFQYTEDDEQSKADAKKKAENMLAQELNDDNFISVAGGYVTDEYKNYLNDQYTKVDGASLSNAGLPAPMTDWLNDDKLNVNDKTIVDVPDNSCFYIVVLTKDKSLNESMQYAVRHILVKPESESETNEYTDEQWAAAEKSAKKILADYKKAKGDEYKFAELAEKSSADTGSTSAGGQGAFGGLYSAVGKGQMVEEFESWSLDSNRKYGDTGIVKTSYGYHIMFFVSAQEGWKYSAQTAIEAKEQEEVSKKVKSKTNLGFKKTTVAKPSTKTDTDK